MIVSIGAFFVRTIGAALFVPVAISILDRTVVNWGVLGRRKALWTVLAVGVLLAGVGLLFRDRFTSPWYAREYTHAHVSPAVVAWWRVGEIGEIVRNVPSDLVAETRANLPIDSTSPWMLLGTELRVDAIPVGTVVGRPDCLWTHFTAITLASGDLFGGLCRHPLSLAV